jgi:hypothetical protein
MTIQITKSFDDAGEPKGSTSLQVYGGASRDAVVQFNRFLTYQANRAMGNPGFQIASNFDINNASAISYTLSNVLKTLAATQTFDTGTAATITANLWGIAILTYDGTTRTVTWATTTAAMSYATEADAKAALGTLASLVPASGFASLGYVTVQAGASLWTAGTDALAGGTGGTPAATTNYYNDPSLDGWFSGLQIGDMAGTVLST